jgi:hypothetical protein
VEGCEVDDDDEEEDEEEEEEEEADEFVAIVTREEVEGNRTCFDARKVGGAATRAAGGTLTTPAELAVMPLLVAVARWLGTNKSGTILAKKRTAG